MAKFRTDILVPLVIAGAVVAQTVGVETSRAVRLHAWFPGAVKDTVTVEADSLVASADTLAAPADSTLASQRDSLPQGDSLALDSLAWSALDTTGRSPLDSLAEEEDFDLFGVEEDTMPRIYARDTMKIPDSLRVTDTFLFHWYVAVKDSFTHRLVIDSLKAEGDSLVWPRIDSLYLADSTWKAKVAWERKWASMSKAERKRWTYEHVELPAILHKQDSIFKRKDSIQHVRDSIRQTTPRILETAFLPDSLFYKRLVTWKRNRLYNRVEPFEWDTTANYHFYDYPFMREDVNATWLGLNGTAAQSYNFFRRNKEENSPSYYEPVEMWTYSAENITWFNTKTPYTEWAYYGNIFTNKTKSADAFRIFTTQNILPSLNISLEMSRYGGGGTLKNEETDNRTYFATANYLGKKYLAHGGFIANKITREESGGVQDNMWIRDTTVDVREVAVNLSAATNRYHKTTLFFDQSYRIPFEFIERLKHRKDTSWVPSDTLNVNTTTGFIGTGTEWTTYSKKYVDNTSTDLSNFYHNVFNINPAKSTDSLRTMRLDNRIFFRLQPWKEDAIVSKIEGGAGYRLQTFYLQQPGDVLYKPVNQKWGSLYAYAGAEGRLSRYFTWDATGMFNFTGVEAGDFSIKAHAAMSVYPFRRHRNSPMTLDARFETTLKTPDFYQQHFYSNHFAWENNFSKVSTTRLWAQFSVPRWEFKAEAGYALLAGNVYYDELGIARQNTAAMSVFSAGLTKNFILGLVHLDNSALFQLSSNQYVLPLPLLALKLRWYLQLNIVDPKVLKLQAGIDLRYFTEWYMPSYNPVAGVFTSQQEATYGNCPIFDLFINLQWKKACIFFKMENMGRGWPLEKHDYFTAHHYIQTSTAFKFGITWPFYPPLGNNRTLSSRAGSGGGMGGGLGGGLGGMLKGNR